MRNAKHGPALFEVLTRQQDGPPGATDVPGWRTGGGWKERCGALRIVGDQEPGGLSARGDLPGRQAPGAIPFVELVGRRVRVSFTSASAGAAVFVAMIAVLTAYEFGSRSGVGAGFRRGYDAGRASYAADQASEVERARSQPAATGLVSALLKGPREEADQSGDAVEHGPPDAAKPQWIRDYTYIVVQEFAADRLDAAQQAQEYVAQHGIPTAFVRLSSGAVQLITTQGHDHKDAAQKQLAQELLEKEQRVGSGYFAAGGGYRLKGYFKTLKGDTW